MKDETGASAASVADVAPVDYARRWHAIVERRRVAMDALYARLGRTTADYWARRSEFFRPSAHRQTGPDRFLAKVLEFVTPETVVLDVGAGGGRYAVPLAGHARAVVAVEPAAPMVRVLREEAARAGVHNLRIVESDWERAEVEPADVVICSHVIYPIADVVPFLRKLDAKMGRVCLLALHAGQPPWELDDLWRHFHAEPPRPQPTYIDAYNLLHQLGISANVEVYAYDRPGVPGGATLEEAAARFRETLILDDRPETTARLHALLRERLVRTADGWQLPPRRAQAAIIWWTPEQRAL
jgi:SAM-dependent methyltransferase